MYERITDFISALADIDDDRAARLVLYQQFLPACHKPDIADREYASTLARRGIYGPDLWHASVELLDLKGVIALLTFILRSDHSSHGALFETFESGYLMRILLRLAELDGTWERPNVVTFFHEDEENGYLSNWYRSRFSFGGYTLSSAELWMMVEKAEVFRDWGIADRILGTDDLGEIKALGRKVGGYSDATWDPVCTPLMRMGLRHRFVQNERLLNDLLSMGSAALGEASPTDDKWGVGFGKNNPKLDDPANWHGRNLLGITLMEVRSDLRMLCAGGGALEWPRESLEKSQVWEMCLLELARIPSTRPMALAYAAIVKEQVSSAQWHDVRDVLRDVRVSIREIDKSMNLNMGGGLPAVGWPELIDELAFQVRVGRV